MPKIYADRIFNKKWIIEQVPERWREETKVELIQKYAKNILSGNLTIEQVPERWREETEIKLKEIQENI